jgi:ornithine cyclodeaminase/alanine dehydrogenase-like protein (mu-crystallin family)
VSALLHLDAAEVASALPPAAAVDAIRAVLRTGFLPSSDIPRASVPLSAGKFLLMPAEVGPSAGIKVLSLAPGNPAAGVPRIQGLYLLLDAATLSPRALLDGAALTVVRTPAVSLAAVYDAVRRDPAPLEVVVFGAGPQAAAHVEATRAVVAGVREVSRVTTVRRGEAADDALRSAGLVVCATTARAPLFDSSLLRDDAVVVAVGSHEPDARELDSALMARARIVVEDSATALRECGDVVMAVAEGTLDPGALLDLGAVVRGSHPLDADRPVVFKSSGMSWEDLVIVEAIVAARL